MSEWQPAETAPKDGTFIDVWVDGQRQTDVVWKKVRLVDHGDMSSDFEGFCFEEDSDVWGYYWTPCDPFTHWMPRPEPPK